MKNLDRIPAALSFQTPVRRVCTVCLLAVCGILAATPLFAANGEAGRVIALTPGAFVERAGQRIPLEMKSPVLESDTIVTDSTGKAQILFADDGSATLGPNTTLALREVAPEGSSASFKAHLGRGVARFLTGKIVEANPGGFAVSTPEGTAGIRGTIFVLQTGNGRTTISVVNASRDVVLNGVSVPGAHELTLPGGAPVPMTPADMEQARSLAAARPASGTDAAQAANLGLASPVDNAGDGDAALTPTALADLGMGTQRLGDSLQVGPKGTITGSLTTSTLTAAYAWSGSFAFDVDLGSGSVSNASMSLSGTLGQDPDGGGLLPQATSVNLSNGSGSVSGNSFSIAGFVGTANWRGTAYSFPIPYNTPINTDQWAGPYAAMAGVISRSGSNASVSGTYTLNAPGSHVGAPSGDRGTFAGSGQLQ